MGKTQEAFRAAKDVAYREKLYTEMVIPYPHTRQPVPTMSETAAPFERE